jgi:hypothetical protein
VTAAGKPGAPGAARRGVPVRKVAGGLADKAERMAPPQLEPLVTLLPHLDAQAIRTLLTDAHARKQAAAAGAGQVSAGRGGQGGS